MSGTEQNNSSNNKDCHRGKRDPIEEFIAAMARLSISGQRRPPLRAARNKGFQKTTKVTLSTLPGTISGKSTDAQEKPPKRQWDDVSPEEDIWAGTKRLSVLGSIYQEEADPNVTQVVIKTECERTEKPKHRRGGVIHRSENNCCPVLPSSRPLPRSHRDLQMEDIRAAGQFYPFDPRTAGRLGD